MSKRILVTGHKGYIGAHLVELLKTAGHEVYGVDLHLYKGCEWAASVRADKEHIQDFRDLAAEDLQGFDAVIHLAALSNDALGELDPKLTKNINEIGSIELARNAKIAGVPLFLFSSSCSIYGKSVFGSPLFETDDLNPLSAYAGSKIEAEKGISELADRQFSPVFLRNATAYGYSPAMRIDLVANDFSAAAYIYNRIDIHSDGSPWRPLIHCRDIAAAFVACLNTDRRHLHNRAINIGDNSANYQVREIAEIVRSFRPNARINYTLASIDDPRSYRVNFDLLHDAIPGFHCKYHLSTGVHELLEAYANLSFDTQAYTSVTYRRVRMLRQRLKDGFVHF